MTAGSGFSYFGRQAGAQFTMENPRDRIPVPDREPSSSNMSLMIQMMRIPRQMICPQRVARQRSRRSMERKKVSSPLILWKLWTCRNQ